MPDLTDRHFMFGIEDSPVIKHVVEVITSEDPEVIEFNRVAKLAFDRYQAKQLGLSNQIDVSSIENRGEN